MDILSIFSFGVVLCVTMGMVIAAVISKDKKSEENQE